MKLIYIFVILMVTACSGQTEKNQKLINSLNNTKMEIRGKLIEISETEYRLDYYDTYEEDSHYNFLDSMGYQGGGPSWLGIIYGAIQMSEPLLLEEIRFDDEAAGIAIWSSNKSSLEKIGRLITEIKSDNELLIKAIKIAEQDGQME
jgi:hypothetical protein